MGAADQVAAAAAAAAGVTIVVVVFTVLLLFVFSSTACGRKFAALVCCSSPKGRSSAPPMLDGPSVYPIIGALHAMGGHQDRPFRRFTELARQYGPVYSMPMGSVPCVVVNDYASIKEVLITNGSKFGGRPDFIRYNTLFSGDRNNSLALCDWSWIQETRRKIARTFCSPKVCSFNYELLDTIASDESGTLLESLASVTVRGSERTVQIKPLLLMACANMFFKFMCSIRFEYENDQFQTVVRTFDEIFWDINQSYAVDFLPWLLPFYANHMKRLSGWSERIRRFIMDTVVLSRRSYKRVVMTESSGGDQRPDVQAEDDDDEDDEDQEPSDFTDALLMSLRDEPMLNMDHVLFELEDFIGGHSAVGNLVMLALSMIATRPHVAQTIRTEARAITGGKRLVCIYDKPHMPYTEAALFETMRMISSPIVPHVATENTTIKGFKISKGTCVIINNYELNTSPAYWDEPEVFNPRRFVQSKPSEKPCIRKPEYFLPFSTGKRTCIGQQLVSGFGFVLLACILQRYEVKATDQLELPEARLALPPDTYPLILTPLNIS